jgi:hypothetical protein
MSEPFQRNLFHLQPPIPDWIVVPSVTVSSTAVNTTTDMIDVGKNHRWRTGDPIKYDNGGGTSICLVPGTDRGKLGLVKGSAHIQALAENLVDAVEDITDIVVQAIVGG